MITRRMAMFAQASFAGTTTVTTAMADDDRDGSLLALRPLWHRTLSEYNGMLALKAAIEFRVFARRPAYSLRKDYDAKARTKPNWRQRNGFSRRYGPRRA